MPAPSRWNRRGFLAAAAGSGVALTFPRIPAADPAPSLRAAVIGHTGRGDYGHGLEEIFRGRPGIQTVALADPDEKGRTRTAARIGAARVYADYREMLAQEKPDLVSLALRHCDQHHAMAVAALQAGAHLFCEKPFVESPAQADEILALAEARNRKVAVAHTMRMAPGVLRLREVIREGVIGDLVAARAHGKQDARAGGEDLMVLGTHLFDLLRLFLGDPQSCSARVLWQGRELRPDDGRRVKDDVGWVAGDEVSAQFAFARGVNATFTSSARLREVLGPWGIEFLGTKGAARILCDLFPSAYLRRSEPWSKAGQNNVWIPLTDVPGPVAAAHHQAPVGDLLDAIAGNREPECSGRNGAWAVEMVMAVYRSALLGRHVTFPLTERAHPLTP